MTDSELFKALLNDADHCPFCGSDCIGGGAAWCHTGLELTVEDLCENCGAKWTDTFTFTHATITEEPDDKPKVEDGDLVTLDYQVFYEAPVSIFDVKLERNQKVRVIEGQTWEQAVKAYMDAQKFWPDVWYLGERGDITLISPGGIDAPAV